MNEECSSRTKFVNVCKIIFYIKLVAQTCVELEGCTRKVSQFLYTAKSSGTLKSWLKFVLPITLSFPLILPPPTPTPDQQAVCCLISYRTFKYPHTISVCRHPRTLYPVRQRLRCLRFLFVSFWCYALSTVKYLTTFRRCLMPLRSGWIIPLDLRKRRHQDASKCRYWLPVDKVLTTQGTNLQNLNLRKSHAYDLRSLFFFWQLLFVTSSAAPCPACGR